MVEPLRRKRIGFEVYLISSVKPWKWDMGNVVSFIKGLGKRPGLRQNVTKTSYDKPQPAVKQKIIPARQVHYQEYADDKMQDSRQLEQGFACEGDNNWRGSCGAGEYPQRHTHDVMYAITLRCQNMTWSLRAKNVI